MSTYVFRLNDISVEDGSPVVSVNNSDSFFGLIEGSQLFIAGKLPATIINHDTTTKTLTLKYNWQQGDLSNVAAQVVPIGAVGVLLQALENNRAAYETFLSLYQGLEARVVALEACHSCGGANDSDTLLRDINGELLFDIEGNQLNSLPQ